MKKDDKAERRSKENLREESMTSVLIVGAGPTGLVLALWLTKAGIKVRIIDKAARAGATSRALVVHARTLEFYRQLGIAEEVAECGFRFPAINLWVEGERRARFDISDIGKGATPFPYVLVYPQDEHEEFLIAKLREAGVEVERSTELLSLEGGSESVRARIRLPGGEEQAFTARFVAGCDGAHSAVRLQTGAEFGGGTYPNWYYVADVAGRGPVMDGQLHISMDRAEFLAVFPLKETGRARIIGVIRSDDNAAKLTWKDVNPRVFQELRIEIGEVHWFSTYHVHHRVASRFQKGRVFLLGDAGHIHSPVGGQGMNTGIGDAVNLGWKLAEVLHGRAPLEILDTYEAERVAFARRLVRTTDFAFRFISSRGPVARLVRTKLAPAAIGRLVKSRVLRRLMFRTVSQTGIHYRHCDLNRGRAGSLAGGDRLPWIESADNFAPLKSLAWQVHVYGDRKIAGVPACHFRWTEEMAAKGLTRDAAYVIRPDGHIGFISPAADGAQIQEYLNLDGARV
jgi:2-polyprenyl-6-methoxyphenol hydroxylase-like FAD-dependent oxidoreductase